MKIVPNEKGKYTILGAIAGSLLGYFTIPIIFNSEIPLVIPVIVFLLLYLFYRLKFPEWFMKENQASEVVSE